MKLRDLEIVDGSRPGPLMSALDVFGIQVVELYLDRLGRSVETDGVAKVVVEFTPVPTEAAERGDQAIFVTWPFDFGRIDRLAPAERKRALLNELHAASLWAAVRHGWETGPFEHAHAACLAAGIVFDGWLLRTDVPHPRLKLGANGYFRFGDEHVDVHVVLRERPDREVGRKLAFRTPVRYDVVRRLLGSLSWAGPEVIRLTPSRLAFGEAEHVLDVSDILTDHT